VHDLKSWYEDNIVRNFRQMTCSLSLSFSENQLRVKYVQYSKPKEF